MSKAAHQRRSVLAIHPGSELYGSDRMLLESLRAFVEQGLEVHVLLPGPGPLVAQVEALGVPCGVIDMPVLRKSLLSPRGLVRLAWSTVRAAPVAWRLLRRLGPDLLYVSTQIVPLWVVMGRVARVPTVCHVHEAERHPRAVVERGLVLPLLAADHVVANSHYSAGVLAAVVPAVGARTTVVHNGVAGPSAPTPARAEATGSVRLIYVGRVSPRKGVDVALAAVRRLHRSGMDARLTVVGSVFTGYEWYETQLRTTYAAEIDRGSVTFTGFQDDVWSALAACDIAIVPSTLPEPFGNTAVEAVLAGRPVVVSDTGGLPEAVLAGPCARVVAPGDAAALAAAVQDVVAEWAQVRPLLDDARLEAADRFSPARYRHDLAAATGVTRTVESVSA